MWEDHIDSVLNLPALGTFNRADAAVTLYCEYDPVTQVYSMVYIYYIIDLYDFEFLQTFADMNALGLARCYELYGVVMGEASWTQNDSFVYYLMY